MIIANMFSNKELNAIVTELFTKDKKLNIPFFYYTILFCYDKNY